MVNYIYYFLSQDYQWRAPDPKKNLITIKCFYNGTLQTKTYEYLNNYVTVDVCILPVVSKLTHDDGTNTSHDHDNGTNKSRDNDDKKKFIVRKNKAKTSRGNDKQKTKA